MRNRTRIQLRHSRTRSTEARGSKIDEKQNQNPAKEIPNKIQKGKRTRIQLGTYPLEPQMQEAARTMRNRTRIPLRHSHTRSTEARGSKIHEKQNQNPAEALTF